MSIALPCRALSQARLREEGEASFVRRAMALEAHMMLATDLARAKHKRDLKPRTLVLRRAHLAADLLHEVWNSAQACISPPSPLPKGNLPSVAQKVLFARGCCR